MESTSGYGYRVRDWVVYPWSTRAGGAARVVSSRTGGNAAKNPTSAVRSSMVGIFGRFSRSLKASSLSL